MKNGNANTPPANKISFCGTVNCISNVLAIAAILSVIGAVVMEFITAGILANKLGHHSFTVAIFLSFRTDITILFLP